MYLGCYLPPFAGHLGSLVWSAIWHAAYLPHLPLPSIWWLAKRPHLLTGAENTVWGAWIIIWLSVNVVHCLSAVEAGYKCELRDYGWLWVGFLGLLIDMCFSVSCFTCFI
jgi:hypothetical protein